ncbi:MAG: type IV pilin protein [Elusimicrobiota bacterium]
MTGGLKISTERGFTLAEVLVCVLIIGVLAAFATPQYFKVVERDKATEAVDMLFSASAAQDRYNAKYGAYCIGNVSACPGFDLSPAPLTYFTAPSPFFTLGGAGAGSWNLTLTRAAPLPSMWLNYTISYDSSRSPRLLCSSPVSGAPDCNVSLIPAP